MPAPITCHLCTYHTVLCTHTHACIQTHFLYSPNIMTPFYTHVSMWLIFFSSHFFLRKKQQENNSEFIQNIFTLFFSKKTSIYTNGNRNKTKQKPLPTATWKGLAVLLSFPPGTRVGSWPGGSAEMDGCKAQLLPWLLWECLRVHSRGSLLAAVLARSRGQSAQRAILGSLFLFPGPSP